MLSLADNSHNCMKGAILKRAKIWRDAIPAMIGMTLLKNGEEEEEKEEEEKEEEEKEEEEAVVVSLFYSHFL